MKQALRFSAAIVVLAGLATVAAGCSDSRLAANNAASNSGQNNGQVQQPNYQVGYGLSSDGPTTDLYTELKGSLQRPERPQAVATVQQASPAGVNGQQPTASSVNGGQQVAAAGPGSSPGAVQQPAAPPRDEPTASAYGMSSDGPTTDVYTALFGSRNR